MAVQFYRDFRETVSQIEFMLDTDVMKIAVGDMEAAVRRAEKARSRGAIVPVRFERALDTNSIIVTGNAETIEIVERALQDPNSSLFKIGQLKGPDLDANREYQARRALMAKPRKTGVITSNATSVSDLAKIYQRSNRALLDSLPEANWLVPFDEDEPEPTKAAAVPVAPPAGRRKIRLED